MAIRIRETGQIVSNQEFERIARARMSFDVLTVDVIETMEADPVLEGAQATLEHPWQYSVQGPVELISNRWVQTYIVAPTFASQEDQDAYVAEYNANRKVTMSSSVHTERDRRKVLGSTFDGVRMTGDATNAFNFTNLVILAQMYMASGDMTTTMLWRDGDNVNHELTAPQILSVWTQSLQYVEHIYRCSWYIKALDVIPADFTDDKYWQLTYWEPVA